MRRFLSIVSVLALVLAFSSVVSAAGMTSSSSNFGQNITYDDLAVSYGTSSSDGTAYMYGSATTSAGTVGSVNMNVYPTWGQPSYYTVSLDIYGTYDKLPTIVGYTSNSLSANHRGKLVSESASIGADRSWMTGDEDGPTGPIWSSGYGSMNLSDFVVDNAYANFNEYKWTEYLDGTIHNDFSYNVNWSGQFTSSTMSSLAIGVGPMTLGTTVPEPSPVLALLALVPVAFLRRPAFRLRA